MFKYVLIFDKSHLTKRRMSELYFVQVRKPETSYGER